MKWNIYEDPKLVVLGLTFFLFLAWFMCLFSFPITITTENGEKTYGYKGWGDKLMEKLFAPLA